MIAIGSAAGLMFDTKNVSDSVVWAIFGSIVTGFVLAVTGIAIKLWEIMP